MSTSIENYFQIEPEREIFYQIWPTKAPKGTFFLTHGVGEHSSCYDKLAQSLTQNGWQVFGWDLKGHGRSSGQRGYVSDFSEHCSDFKKVFKFFKQKLNLPDLPVVLFGHSMGAAILLRSFIENRLKPVSAICLSSPALGIHTPPNAAKETLAQFANKYLPRLTLSNDIDPQHLTQMPEQLEFYEKDTLRHGKMNPRTYLGLVESFDIIFKKVAKINTPILFQLAKDEKVVSLPKSKQLFKKISQEEKQMIIYSNSRHEIFNDIEQEQATEDLLTFIKALI